MQWLAQVCVRRPVFAVMLILAMVVAGAASYAQLGVDRFPKMDMPTVIVVTNYPGAAAKDVESEVSQILEDAVATVAGIDELRSISRQGVSLSSPSTSTATSTPAPRTRATPSTPCSTACRRRWSRRSSASRTPTARRS
jgi:hypothetical protein